MKEDTIEPLRQHRSAKTKSSSAKNETKAGTGTPKRGRAPPSVAVVAEEVVGGLPAAKTFSSSRLGSVAAAKELIKDAELAEARPPSMANPSVERTDEKRPGDVGKGSSSSSSSGGVDGGSDFNLGGSTKPKTAATGGPSVKPPLQQQPQLPGPTEDMRKKAIIMDLLERRETSFELEEGLQPSLVPRSDAYVVSTKKALRPWDGPHADRAETHVVVLLTDVYGHDDSFTRNTADEIAEICDAIVVVPDMFRKRPWTPEESEEEYEAWRASHDPVGG